MKQIMINELRREKKKKHRDDMKAGVAGRYRPITFKTPDLKTAMWLGAKRRTQFKPLAAMLCRSIRDGGRRMKMLNRALARGKKYKILRHLF